MIKAIQQLSLREQRLLFIGGGILLIILLWVFIYRPTQHYLQDQAEIKARLAQQLVIMERDTRDLKPERLQPLKILASGTTFSTWIDDQLGTLGIQQLVKRSEPIDNNTVSLWMEQAPFDKVADWLQQINDEYGIIADQADINVTDRTLGLVTIRMRLVKK